MFLFLGFCILCRVIDLKKKNPCLLSRQGLVAEEILAVPLIFFYIIGSILALSYCSYYELNNGGRPIIPKLQ